MELTDGVLKFAQLGTNGLLIFALWQIWGEYKKSQAAYVVLLERCVTIFAQVNSSLNDLKEYEKPNH